MQSPLLPSTKRKIHQEFKEKIKTVFYTSKCYINRAFFLENFLRKKGLHIGCGDQKIDDFINVDVRATKATDLLQDCAEMNFSFRKRFNLLYSNAFFEHLYRNQRLNHLKKAINLLSPSGQLVYFGMPDFEMVAKSYLNKQKGTTRKYFDLLEVYRYTHGDPEVAPDWWIWQLHKSLFDKQTLVDLLSSAGINNYVIFRYSFSGEQIPLNLGFIASKKPINVNVGLIENYSSRFGSGIAKGSVEIISKKSKR